MHYSIYCPSCGGVFDDDGLLLTCSCCREPSLLQTSYKAKTMVVDDTVQSLFRYRNWLPIRRCISGNERAITYRSAALAKVLGLKNLWIAFSGYWPERDAWLLSCSFKELEALTVVARLPAELDSTMTVASAGNTAAAFARICSLTSTRCVIVIPDSALPRLAVAGPVSQCVQIISIAEGDYGDAIRLAETIATMPGFFPEGGGKNVGRRDGLGSVMLSACEVLGVVPEYYFQAVGSGTGAIGAFEAAKRIATDSKRIPRLFLSQNYPFTPIRDTWLFGTSTHVYQDEKEARGLSAQVYAAVLVNGRPPIAHKGGLLDALRASQGMVFSITNEEARYASWLFEECEGIDIDPAAAVAVASLIKAVKEAEVIPESVILLNISGGGVRKRCYDCKLFEAPAATQVTRSQIEDPYFIGILLQRLCRS